MNTNIFDKDQLLENLDHDMDLIKDLVEIYISTIEERLKEIDISIKTSDYEALRVSAHTLKGSSSNFFANNVVEISAKLEALGKNKTLENTNEIFNQLKNEVELLSKSLQDFIS